MATVENAPLNETAMNEDVVVTVEKITPQELAAHGMEVLEADSDAVKEAVKKHDAIEEAKLAAERPPPPAWPPRLRRVSSRLLSRRRCRPRAPPCRARPTPAA